MDQIGPIFGTRGRWLASLNPAWSGLLAPAADSADLWQTGERSQRAALLRDLRSHDPGRARELLQSSWADETPEDRAAFLSLLGQGLSMEDEPLLEAARDDKRKPVRSAALDLLTRLPESQYCRRMAEHATPLVHIEHKQGLLGRRKLLVRVNPPPEDLKLSREGIESRTHGKLGPRAWMLAQIVAATPLDAWTRDAKSSPAEIIEAAGGGEWSAAVVLGWTMAAARQGRADWAAPLLDLHLGSKASGESDEMAERIEDLVRCLPPDKKEVLAGSALHRLARPRDSRLLTRVLSGCTHAWSPAFTQTVFEAMRSRIEKQGGYYDPLMQREWAAFLVVHAHPGLTDKIVQQWSSRVEHWQPAQQRFADELLSLLQFRREYLKELSS